MILQLVVAGCYRAFGGECAASQGRFIHEDALADSQCSAQLAPSRRSSFYIASALHVTVYRLGNEVPRPNFIVTV